ncbi:MAG TPA: hypothetical protein VLX92_10810 [Kofleriaceae bacterium]|nr:hypothetical protein [Kofleriaceae bacterium]
MIWLRRHLARHGEWWWVPVLYTLVVIWIYRDLWHQHGIATGLGWDTIDTHGPDLDFFARELREGRFSLWNPYDKGGYPIFCDPVFDRYYPYNWPFAAWGAIAGTSWWLIQIEVLGHHVVAGICMHAFVRSRRLPARAAIVAGIALCASTPLLVHKASNVLWPLVWVPLVWIAIDAALARPSWRRGAALAAALVPCITAGSPPGLFYAMLLVAPYAAWRAVTALRGADRAHVIQIAGCFTLAGALAGLALALTVLPTRELVALGSRDRFATGPDFALVNSLPLPEAARGTFVRGAGLFEMYLGAGVVLLAACALAVRPRFDRGAAIVLAATGVLGVVLAAGSTAGVLPWLVAHVPGFGLLRVPGRYKLLSAWSIAACAGYGTAALEAAWRDRAARRVIACAAAGVALSVLFVVGWGRGSPTSRPPWWSIVAMAVPAALAIAAVRAPRRWADAALAGLALCALIDAPVMLFVLPAAPPAAEPRQTHERDAEIAARLDGARDRFRIYDEYVLGERAGARLRLRDFRGYPALDPISLHRYVDVLDYAKRDSAIITDFNVRWLLHRPHFRYGASVQFAAPGPAFVDRGGALWEARHPAPLAAWYGALVVIDPPHVLEAMRSIQDGDGTRRRAVIEPDVAARLPLAEALEPDERDGVLESYQPDEIRFAIDAPRAGLVVLDEIAFPGWQVAVDGAPAEPLRANYLMRAVWVPAGHHEIAWRFEPAHWRLLVAGYALALATIIAAAAAAAWRRRPARAAGR